MKKLIRKIVDWYRIRKALYGSRTKNPSLCKEIYGVFKNDRLDILREWLNLYVVEKEIEVFRNKNMDTYRANYERVAAALEILAKLENVVRVEKIAETRKQ